MIRALSILISIGLIQTIPRCTVEPHPTAVIFDTDIGPDCDDAGALAVLHALANRGEAKVLAMGSCSSSEWGGPVLDAINTFYGRPDLPVGTWKGFPIVSQSKYAEQVAKEFTHDTPSGTDLPEAWSLYRDMLTTQPDHTVTIIAVGPLNNLYELLQHNSDLVARKVRELVVMGGEYPYNTGATPEFNFRQGATTDRPPFTAYVIEHWPTPIVFSGYEIGHAIITGTCLAETSGENPVRRAYEIYNGSGNGRYSYDLTAVLYAVRGLRDYWRLHHAGGNVILEDGSNIWNDDLDADQAYLVPLTDPGTMESILDDLLCNKK